MALLDPSFVLGIIVLVYLSSFVLFAVIRVLTGLSIQRLGYFSLRRLAYTPRDGINIKIRGLGLNLHRPTFSQPTWMSIKVKELAVTVDIKELERQKQDTVGPEKHDDATNSGARVDKTKGTPKNPLPRRATFGPARSVVWKQLMRIKEKLKRLHRNVHWLRMVDVVAADTTVTIVDIGNVQLGSFTIALDTRRRMSDRARYFFQSGAEQKRQKHSAEWIVTLRSVLFTANGGESIEVLDSATLNVHGFLYEQLDGLRDAAIALKLGRVHVPYDDMQKCLDRFRKIKGRQVTPYRHVESLKVSIDEVIQEIDQPGSTDEDLMQTVSDSKEFVSSILRGIKEVQFAVSFVSLTKEVNRIKSTGSPLLLNASMKEVGIDLHRLDPKSPAHRMYFPSKDIAHEAQVVGLSISVGLDDGHGKPERVVYIPMATTTLKTTLPSKTVELSGDVSAEDRNANMLFGNSVVTEPSVDLDPKHLPILLALLRPRPKAPKAQVQQRHMIISRLLPKANFKFSMQQPVVRITLPPVQKTDDPDDFDLIISSISSISLDVESFHSAVKDFHYSLASSLRVQTHSLYYQTAQGDRFDLIDTESFDLKLQVSVNPDVHVIANGHVQTFAMHEPGESTRRAFSSPIDIPWLTNDGPNGYYRESRRKMSTGDFRDDKMLDVVADAMRLAVPHELIVSQISDNIINVIKASEQVAHRFKTGTNEYILDKAPQGPKDVPKISLRTRTLLFELEDGAFEWKLGMIYRAGRVEQEARTRLHEHNAQSWKKRIDHHYAMSRSTAKELRALFLGPDELPDELEDTERILEVPERPALMSTIVTDLHVKLDKPSFPIRELPDFLYKVGKGMPKSMKYSLLIPMSVAISMGEARVNLRDYPLPLLHVPAIKSGQSSKTPALSLQTDFVIAEEFRGSESTRRMQVQIIPPPDPDSETGEIGFAIDVRRTIGPVKSYSNMQIDINTAYPTRITWGPSYQPAIQDMMMVIESFTKPQLDPSERVGFWDKIRLNFHSRIRVAWKGDGDVHLALKGTRDPYCVTGNGAGFLMCWRSNVRWGVNTDDDPKRLMMVDSGEFVLAVPDYSHQVRESARRTEESDSIASETSYKSGAIFKKVAMKVSGNVQWMAGLMFERAIENGQRSFDTKPHYEVVLKAPSHVKQEEGELPYDAFRGFRSQHIHLSIAVRAPADRDWASSEPQSSKSYNTVHLTPRLFTHFFAWWSLFSGPMSLPIRQGPLWPGREKGSKKFGRHLGTIKYNILLAPLFMSHIYKHKDVEDYSENAVSATGIKVRFDSFMVDIHQRREEFNIRDRGRKTNARTTGMKIHAAQLDLISADVRAVSASIKGTTTEAIKRNSISTLITQNEDDVADLSHFTIPDNDFSWIDMDDFVELDWILPSESNPDTKILPLAYAPRVTYFRQTDIGGTIDGDPDRTSPFGNEPTHFCIMSQDDDPRRVQSQLIQTRLDQLDGQIATNIRDVGEAELRNIRTDGKDPEVSLEFETLNRHTNVLQDKHTFMSSMLEEMAFNIQNKDRDSNSSFADEEDPQMSDTHANTEDGEANVPSGTEFASDFKNRFVVHNMQLKWNNLLRNIILRYSHQVSQRRGFVYYLSRPAVKFILDIVEEQARAKSNSKPPKTPPGAGGASAPKPSKRFSELNPDFEKIMQQMIQDGRKFVNTDESDSSSEGPNMEDLTSNISDEFTPQSSFHVRLIAPQIQLQSDKNKKHVVLITAKGMELKVVEVMDKARLSDEVSGLVQRRFLLRMDSAQFFVTHQKWFSGQLLSMYSGNTYGTPSGTSWPPWVPMEVMFDFQSDPFGFKRVVQKTSAMLRHDRFNTLRLKYNDEVNSEGNNDSEDNSESRMDNLWVEFPQARALCNSSQYYAIYIIVLDLLMYSEPLEKTRNERLEKIMLASDFSDLRGAPEMVTKLQERIRQLEDIKAHFQVHFKYLDKKGWEDRLLLERDLAACEDELFFIMKAITSSQRKYETASQSSAFLKWTIQAKEIVWHLLRDNNEPLVELQLQDTQYHRTDNSDGSHRNLFQVGKVIGLNLLPDAIYPQMVAPYFESGKSSIEDLNKKKMVRVYWQMLEAIAGIPVMDHFEVNLFPLKIQLERELGKKLFEYIFPGTDGDKSNTDSQQPETPFIIKQNWPGEAEDETPDDTKSVSSNRLSSAASDKESAFTTRAGSLELRLRPTLSSETPAIETRSQKTKAVSVHTGEGNVFRLFSSKTAGKKPSYESLRSNAAPRPGLGRSPTTASTSSDPKRPARFALLGKHGNSNEKPPDDLTKMLTRASNYMTFVHIKMPSVVLCLSYKGKGDRNLEDVHDFVFRLPTIEFRNKTWSNLDLALALKSHVIKALISHTGAIIGNKFSKHRPNSAQQSKLRELATSSVLLATPAISSNSGDNSDDSSSIFSHNPMDFSRSPPRSIRSAHTNIPVPRPSSRSSSAASTHSYQRANGGGSPSEGLRGTPVPGFTMMSHGTSDDTSATGLGIDTERPHTSASNLLGPFRPGSSGSALRGGEDTFSYRERRKSAGSGFLRGKLTAFASRLRDRSPEPVSVDDSSSVHEDTPVREEEKSRGGMSWTGRTRTGF
ncbi:hypothetical protein UCREL1_10307 [Eutypa lata UCREL1]|uniref:Uncharacterized protein n=1 Tax=Eutypa lata (strain UCR-EL1) TaxID=1287681 RepID=M7SYV0_EUTLA|nr:hypothetical protein UCREL1_10307 [Eutypa lata UCREL1]